VLALGWKHHPASGPRQPAVVHLAPDQAATAPSPLPSLPTRNSNSSIIP